MSTKGKKVVIAMNGGVDSSVAAAMLVEQGYEVVGMMLRLWSDPGSEVYNRCCTPASMSMARRIAAQLEIPFYAVDAKNVFKDQVVDYFIEGYSQGVTPNPCLMCNRHIRWEFLLNKALSLDAEYMATGHYARVIHEEGQPVQLLKGIDESKDQSYVLSVLNQSQLSRALFPLGEFTKTEIREMAESYKLPVAKTKDSQDLCFLGGSNYASFLEKYAPNTSTPGQIIQKDGNQLGEHNGLAFYTIGQRKGLGLSSPVPLYVIEKDIQNNQIIVGPMEELGRSELSAGAVNWVTGDVPDSPFAGEIKIRYQASNSTGVVTPIDSDKFNIAFDQPLRDITPGQAAVVYQGEEVIANGIIEGENELARDIIPVELVSK